MGTSPWENSWSSAESYTEECPGCGGNMICEPYGVGYHCRCKRCGFEMEAD